MRSGDVSLAGKNLEKARALAEKTYETQRGASGQYFQWLEQTDRLHILASQQHMPEHVTQRFDALKKRSTAAMTEQKFCALPSLAQRGLIEVLCVLCDVLSSLVAQYRYAEALNMVVRAQYSLCFHSFPA